QSIDVVAVPSRHEAWGMTVFEALCLGVPVVASAVGNLPELCQAAPHAHLIPGDDPAAIVAGIRYVFAPSFPHGPDLGQRYCQQPHFAPEQRFQQWLALYSIVSRG
ncbi:MAG: glycosyltransferase, partial [Chloroflexi bacterium]|nr:glycosyltransferase [Chloroflexota bacterium]